jgi:carbon storage regulator
MLILTRQVGEDIVIGEAVTVTVLGIKQGQVRLGIQAPKQIKVLRGELLENPKDPSSAPDNGASAPDTG